MTEPFTREEVERFNVGPDSSIIKRLASQLLGMMDREKRRDDFQEQVAAALPKADQTSASAAKWALAIEAMWEDENAWEANGRNLLTSRLIPLYTAYVVAKAFLAPLGPDGQPDAGDDDNTIRREFRDEANVNP